MADDKERKVLFKDLSYATMGAAMAVHNELGPGFLEAVYRRAMMVELGGSDLKWAQETPIPVRYRGHVVGDYRVDILVDDKIVLELKACKAISDAHVAQALNYLAATGLRLAIIINFGQRKLDYRRVVR